MKHLRSPIVWFGGKGNMVAKILPLFPEHHIYVEPFGGGASLLMAKEPSAVKSITTWMKDWSISSGC